ncbi:hypothetical protein D3C79_626460 [compost metagenome]
MNLSLRQHQENTRKETRNADAGGEYHQVMTMQAEQIPTDDKQQRGAQVAGQVKVAEGCNAVAIVRRQRGQHAEHWRDHACA